MILDTNFARFTTHALFPKFPKDSWVLEWIRIRVEGQIWFEHGYAWTRKFLNPQRKMCRFKNIRILVDEASSSRICSNGNPSLATQPHLTAEFSSLSHDQLQRNTCCKFLRFDNFKHNLWNTYQYYRMEFGQFFKFWIFCTWHARVKSTSVSVVSQLSNRQKVPFRYTSAFAFA